MFSLGRRFVLPFANRLAYASEAYVSLKSSINDLSPVLITFDKPPKGSRDRTLLQVVDSLTPETAEGLVLTRLGGDTDGGYVMSSRIDVERAISIGVGADVSWDIDLAQRGVEVHAFDHTVKRLPQIHPNVHFHRVGLGDEHGCLPLNSLLGLAGVNGSCLLKVDIEGAEWAGLATAEFQMFSQVILELHDLNQVLKFPERVLLLARLHETHAPVHLHANNYGTIFRGDSYWFPDVVEVSFVRRDLYRDWTRATMLSNELDRRCDPRVPEISLAGILNR